MAAAYNLFPFTLVIVLLKSIALVYKYILVH